MVPADDAEGGDVRRPHPAGCWPCKDVGLADVGGPGCQRPRKVWRSSDGCSPGGGVDCAMDLQRRTEELVRRLGERVPGLEHALDLAHHGEEGLALEALVSQLDDHDVCLSQEDLRQVEQLALDFGHTGLELDVIRALPRPGDGRRRSRVVTVGYVRDTASLHGLLQRALGFPDWYGANWNAFWDAITGLVEMPETLVLRDWDVLASRLSTDAMDLLELLLQAERSYPANSSAVVLVDGEGKRLQTQDELSRLTALHE